MSSRTRRARRCSYVVPLNERASEDEVQGLARYLSTLGGADCEVIILDAADGDLIEQRARVLRWVGLHCPVATRYRQPNGEIDVLRAAAEIAPSEKIIIALPSSRYTVAAIGRMCEMLDRHEVVEPEQFIDPLPWWGGIEAGRLLLLRGVDQPASTSSTFGFRKSAFQPLRVYEELQTDWQLRRLLFHGADHHVARDLFVRHETPRFGRWLAGAVEEAENDFSVPTKATFFIGLLPVLVLLAIVGGTGLAGGYAGVIAAASVMLAVRGRIGAARFFPVHACLFAPVWIVERSIGTYWVLVRRMISFRAAKTARNLAGRHAPTTQTPRVLQRSE